jgi:acyl-[acyl-carrier-protein] desaturase
MADLEKRVFENEWNLPQDSHLGMLAYAMVQEQVTFLNYRNLRARAKALGGDPALEKLLGYVSIDEAAHHDFFKDAFAIFLEQDRETALAALRRVIDEFQMPAIHDLLDNSARRVAQIRDLEIFSEDIFYRDVMFALMEELNIGKRELRPSNKPKKSSLAASW